MTEPTGLFKKYEVYRIRRYYGPDSSVPSHATRELVEEDCMVLKLSDPHARRAIAAYADSVQDENRDFASDLRAWLRNERWDDRLYPGGWVCATCGVPVESEPCREHMRGVA